jgi:hypothetical protein
LTGRGDGNMKRKRETWVVRRPVMLRDDDTHEHHEDLERYAKEEMNKVERLLLDNGLISMNHWDTGDLSAMRSAEDIFQCRYRYILKTHKKALSLDIQRMSLDNKRIIARALWMFIHDIQVGDIVVLPCENGTYAIGIVEGDYEYKEISSIVTHTRRVRWHRTDAVIDAVIDAEILRGAPDDRLIDLFIIGRVTGKRPYEWREDLATGTFRIDRQG